MTLARMFLAATSYVVLISLLLVIFRVAPNSRTRTRICQTVKRTVDREKRMFACHVRKEASRTAEKQCPSLNRRCTLLCRVPKEERSTTKYMTKYERARVLGTRALQISMGAPVMVELEGESDPLIIAQKVGSTSNQSVKSRRKTTVRVT